MNRQATGLNPAPSTQNGLAMDQIPTTSGQHPAMNRPVAGQGFNVPPPGFIPVPAGNIQVAGPSGYQAYQTAHGGQQWDYTQQPNDWNFTFQGWSHGQNNSKTDNFLTLFMTKMFQNLRYFNHSKILVHRVAKVPTSCLNLLNYQQFYLLGILGKLKEK